MVLMYNVTAHYCYKSAHDPVYGIFMSSPVQHYCLPHFPHYLLTVSYCFGAHYTLFSNTYVLETYHLYYPVTFSYLLIFLPFSISPKIVTLSLYSSIQGLLLKDIVNTLVSLYTKDK